jgi:hypothetical protein
VDLSCAHDGGDPPLPLCLAGARKTGVEFGEDPVESGDGTVQGEHLGRVADRINER